NVAEASRALGGDPNEPGALSEIGSRLSDLLAGTTVLITQGAEGMTLFRDGREGLHLPAVARHVYDVTGAGDTVVGVLALALAAGAPIEAAVSLANRAAGVVVGKLGTATVANLELLDELVRSTG
ncbi:MAG: PfkB family carbohydrate kinase, partial [Chloroflexales bacterium]|nr:PfkB family carbohydrate kinase [Chloroflexales bacterium]